MQAETLERFSGAFADCGFRAAAFYPAYGLAEASLKVSGGERGRGAVIFDADPVWLQRNRVREAVGGPARRLVGCGRPGLDTRVVIADPDSRRRCAPDEVGEIWVSGPGVARGYWQRPEETRETFGAYLADTGEGPFLRTGDLGFERDGELYIAGRLKDLVIIRGLNHHPNDIEATARRAHPAVASSVAAAFAVEAGGEERLALVIEAGRREPDDAKAIAAAVRQAIAEEHEVQLYAFAMVPKGRFRGLQAAKCSGDSAVRSTWPASCRFSSTTCSRKPTPPRAGGSLSGRSWPGFRGRNSSGDYRNGCGRRRRASYG